jgi:general secretion pathway protein G
MIAYGERSGVGRSVEERNAFSIKFAFDQPTHEEKTSTASVSARGFTLLELLVVIAIIGLLASYVAPKYFVQVGKAEIKATRAQLDAFEKALGSYRLDTGHYPTTEQSLRALIERPANESKWAGPYLAKSLPVDPWGHAYIYRVPGDNGRDYVLMSFGKDGQAGGAGEDADVNAWDPSR